jgi:hypothetical protein
MDQPAAGIRNRIKNKIQVIDNNEYGTILSPFRILSSINCFCSLIFKSANKESVFIVRCTRSLDRCGGEYPGINSLKGVYAISRVLSVAIRSKTESIRVSIWNLLKLVELNSFKD